MIKRHLRTILLIVIILLSFSIQGLAEESYDGYIVKFKDGITVPVLNEDNNILSLAIPSENIYTLTNETEEYIEYLKNSDIVEYIEPNYRIDIPIDEMNFGQDDAVSMFTSLAGYGFTEPNDPLFPLQWHLPMINAEAGWSMGASSDKIKIAIIDSGNPSCHPDITQNISLGKDYTDTTVYDTYGHSTFVSGIIAADTNNNMGTAGILQNVDIIPLKVFKDGSTISNIYIANAMNDAIDIYNCDIINLSLTSSYTSNAITDAIQKALDKNIIVVAAVGNYGTTQLLYPASNDGVIGVGSVTRSKTWASHSQHNSSVDVVAPGFSVYSTKLSNSAGKITYSYNTGSGTSYATPHVSAAAAIAKYYKPDITHDEFMEVLENTCEQLGGYTSKNDYYGYGLINIDGIINYLAPNATPAPSTADVSENGLYISTYYSTVNTELTNILSTIEITNNTDNDITGNLYIASYTNFTDKNGKSTDILKDVKIIQNVTVAANSVNATGPLRNINTAIDTSGSRSYIKICFWNENMQPLITPYQYEIKY